MDIGNNFLIDPEHIEIVNTLYTIPAGWTVASIKNTSSLSFIKVFNQKSQPITLPPGISYTYQFTGRGHTPIVVDTRGGGAASIVYEI